MDEDFLRAGKEYESIVDTWNNKLKGLFPIEEDELAGWSRYFLFDEGQAFYPNK